MDEKPGRDFAGRGVINAGRGRGEEVISGRCSTRIIFAVRGLEPWRYNVTVPPPACGIEKIASGVPVPPGNGMAFVFCSPDLRILHGVMRRSGSMIFSRR
ncbi:hypothetical protein NL676_029720 [Syzygium grande]|nr:hypothetical protein NL676_029720 [Syzygium grande]